MWPAHRKESGAAVAVFRRNMHVFKLCATMSHTSPLNLFTTNSEKFFIKYQFGLTCIA